jgi:hypothetical protein
MRNNEERKEGGGKDSNHVFVRALSVLLQDCGGRDK